MQLGKASMEGEIYSKFKGTKKPYKKLIRMVQLILAITIAAIAVLVTIYYTQ